MANFEARILHKSKVILPDEEHITKESFHELMDQPVDQQVQDDPDGVAAHLLSSALLIHESKTAFTREESLSEDFFEKKCEEPSGAIGGMDLTTEDEESQEKNSNKKQQELQANNAQPDKSLSISMDCTSSIKNKDDQKIRGSAISDQTSEYSEDVHTGTESIRASKVTITDMLLASKDILKQSIDVQADTESISRHSRVTILDISPIQNITSGRVSKSGLSTHKASIKKSIDERTRRYSQEIPKYEAGVRRQSKVSKQTIDGAQTSRSTLISSLRQESEERIKRPSIYYEAQSRIEIVDDITEFFDLDRQEPEIFMDEAENVEEEFEPVVVEEEEKKLDRQPYYDKYTKLSEIIGKNRITNNIRQKLVIMYLRRRKVQHFLKDVEPPLDQTLKYGKKLDAYGELIKINEEQRDALTQELDILKTKRDKKYTDLSKMFKNMQTRESNIGHGLIYSKTGNQIPDKLVERFIRRQANQTEQVYLMRLKFIKLKEMVQEKLDAMDRLDTLDANKRLSDFEQLKAENRAHADKIEEREEELARLRVKCQNVIQILAHLREKTSAFESDLFDLKDQFQDVDETSKILREDLAFLKYHRDRYRNMTRKVIEESGLLSKPDLLKDMEKSLNTLKILENELVLLQKDSKTKTRHIRNIRKNIERTKMQLKSKSKRLLRQPENLGKANVADSAGSSMQIYKRRPTLYMPEIKQCVFNELVNIKSLSKLKTRRRH
ncbi:coiled-coil domain-containing protein 96 [Anthonomus grandis grandis]|uniref:coiled-coil domain-containing protein 96 n=1 Tax=Anthonomus grandis grandis TaxID=2921223 RepID=UPI002165E068|nr:coiled-coil domain-containing protein 96 [Anthonomus grandis grandis]